MPAAYPFFFSLSCFQLYSLYFRATLYVLFPPFVGFGSTLRRLSRKCQRASLDCAMKKNTQKDRSKKEKKESYLVTAFCAVERFTGQVTPVFLAGRLARNCEAGDEKRASRHWSEARDELVRFCFGYNIDSSIGFVDSRSFVNCYVYFSLVFAYTSRQLSGAKRRTCFLSLNWPPKSSPSIQNNALFRSSQLTLNVRFCFPKA